LLLLERIAAQDVSSVPDRSDDFFERVYVPRVGSTPEQCSPYSARRISCTDAASVPPDAVIDWESNQTYARHLGGPDDVAQARIV